MGGASAWAGTWRGSLARGALALLWREPRPSAEKLKPVGGKKILNSATGRLATRTSVSRAFSMQANEQQEGSGGYQGGLVFFSTHIQPHGASSSFLGFYHKQELRTMPMSEVFANTKDVIKQTLRLSSGVARNGKADAGKGDDLSGDRN
jgi:hypothetical protein